MYVHFGSEVGTVAVTDSLFCQNDGTSITGPWTDGGDNQFLETCPPDCNGDINHDGQVNVSDLLAVISGWDNPYNVDDLLIVIANWGNCL
jgi:hypothetical protein